MPTKKKKFIDKKNAVTFRLVHRSQKDPLQADETAPKHVLFEQIRGKPFQEKPKVDPEKRLSEQKKYGVYFDDDYNYLQHLKDVNTVAEWEPVVEKFRINKDQTRIPEAPESLNLPSSVFASAVEEKVGLLNKAAPVSGPRPDWDPDIVAALDDDFDFENDENQLEDDFMQLAGAPGNESDFQVDVKDEHLEDDFLSSEDEDTYHGSRHSSDGFTFHEEEVKTKFTNYSLSSSVIPRSEALQTLDDRFEQMMENYDDENIGALDGEEIEGSIDPNSTLMDSLVESYQKQVKILPLKDVVHSKDAIQEIKPYINVEGTETSTEDEEMVKLAYEEPSKEDRWDCESILSTYSNLYNHPKLISEPKTNKIEISQRTGLPKNVLEKKGLTKNKLKQLDQSWENQSAESEEEEDLKHERRSVASKLSVASTIRSKNETPEERKARKSVVKEFKKERRVEKKANKAAFKSEEIKQQQIMSNLRNNLSGIKLL